MKQLAQDFRAFVLSQDIPNCTIAQLDDEHITLTKDGAVGQVNFYFFDDEPDIVELCIVDLDCPEEPKFFLHFALEDEARAEELFFEMAQVLQEEDVFKTTHVLLCCTSGLTTTMFANKLAEAAKTLSLDYSFSALSLDRALQERSSYDAILLAPQVSYQRKAVVDAYPDAVVVEIPAKVFASYDAGAALKLVMHALSDSTLLPSQSSDGLKPMREMKNDATVMVISVIACRRSSWIGWRIYDHGTIVTGGSITKPSHNLRDLEDLLATMRVKGWNLSELDAIGIAVPGVVNSGTVADASRMLTDYQLSRVLSKRYGTKIFVDNNANAAAVGCYVSQDDYDSLVLHTQQTGMVVPGQGIVVDGHLVKGRKNFAGEMGPLFSAVHGTDDFERLADEAWTQQGMLRIVAPILAADISLVSPDAIFVAVDLLDDMDALRDAIAEYFTDRNDSAELYIPDLIHVSDYRERIALGELALCLQKLHEPRPHRKH